MIGWWDIMLRWAWPRWVMPAADRHRITNQPMFGPDGPDRAKAVLVRAALQCSLQPVAAPKMSEIHDNHARRAKRRAAPRWRSFDAPLPEGAHAPRLNQKTAASRRLLEVSLPTVAMQGRDLIIPPIGQRGVLARAKRGRGSAILFVCKRHHQALRGNLYR
jgi:hypothetical protein